MIQSANSQTTGSITGYITDAESRVPLPMVNITIQGTTLGSPSDFEGKYLIQNVPSGDYILIISAVGYEAKEISLSLAANETIQKNIALREKSVEISGVTVFGASFKKERITDAPASVSLIDTKDIIRTSSSGQLPKILESQPGIDLAQNGLFDFNINTRGFNSSLNRRMLILLDGRDLGTAFLGATEWNGLSIPLEELGHIELVRGPGSALYGANAYNGVINISSFPPRLSPGTKIITGVGEMNMYRGDIRHAGITGNWSYKVNAGGISGKSYSVIRTNQQFEYAKTQFHPVLNDEVTDLDLNPIQTMYASARVDYEYEGGGFTTLEGGIAQAEREVIVTGIGRVQAIKAQRPWGRLHYTGHGFNFLLWSNGRINKEPERSLSTGLPLIQDASITHSELQYNFTALENKLFVVGGISHRFINIDTKETLMLLPRRDNTSGIFAQGEYKFSEQLKTVVAARFDRSTLHENFISPKAAVVWSPWQEHTFRLTYNRAFQAPNYSELFLYVKHPFKALAYLGNDQLKVEKISGFEIGYKGVLEHALFVSADIYYNEMRDFISDLGPGLNLNYPYSTVLPSDPPTYGRLIWSYTNAGKVTEAGYELSANYYLTEHWTVDANFSYFSFKILEGHPNDPNNNFLVPNAPRYKFNIGATYSQSSFDLGVKMKYVPSFFWSAGVFRGDILTYTLLDFSGSYHYSENLSMSMSIANVLNREHWEIFGGSLLKRRATATISASF
ncbi:MAG: TonB-dependent receptor [Ignavibacteriae bacterium]|nr:TonB-dependent receptor [Ignavibacteriota bacterium]